MKELVLYIARALVDHPEAVGVEEAEGGAGETILKLSVARDDLGKIIGRQGRTARALRTLVNAASARQKRRAVLEIQE